MPFTFSHPLYAVPLRRMAPKWLSVTGLVLGSMIPDMEYFMAMQSYQTIGHSFRGFLVQGLPLSISIAFAFHMIVKPALPKFLPSAGRLDQFAKSMTSEQWKLNSAHAWLVFLVSLYIGYLTHMFMDAWTHGSGVFVDLFPILRGKVGGENVYQLLQYLLSLIGMIVPAFILLRRYRRWIVFARKERLPALSSAGTKALLWGTALVFGILLFSAKLAVTGDHTSMISALIVAPLSSALFGIFLASLFYRAAKNRKIARAFVTAGLLLLAIAAFRFCEYIWTPHLLNRPFANFKGNFQTLWNAYIWGWSVMLLISSRMIADKRTNARIRVRNKGRTRSV